MGKIGEKELEKNVDTKDNISENVNSVEKDVHEKDVSDTPKVLEEIESDNVTEISVEKDNTDINEISAERNINNILQMPEDENWCDVTETFDEKTCKETVVNNKRHSKILIATICIFIILGAFLFSTIFALSNVGKNTIIPGVSIHGIDVSGLTKEEAYNKVETIINEKLSKPFNLVYNNISNTVSAQQFEFNFDIQASVDTAYRIGKDGNIFKNNFSIISALIYKNDIIPSFSYNEEAINSLALEIEANIPNKLVEPSYYVENSNLIISSGTDGVVIDMKTLNSNIAKYVNDFNANYENIDIPVITKVAKDIDINTIHSEIYKEAKDAYYTKEPFTVYPHEDGIDFGISMDEVKELLKEEKESYIIPLKITKPNITTNQIGTDAFPDLLATFSSSYSTRNVNRTTNILLASSKINGIVLMPGETFSYNTTVGKRTAAAGFKTAAVYSGGEVTTGIGGGICQVSSTLYNSVLLSNLEIVERHNHGFNPGYVKAGTDATVSWGGPDFKFKNNRNYPIKVICLNSGGTITIQIFGLKEENDYEVEIEAYVTSYIPYKTITKQTSSLKAGERKVIESGSNGCNTVSYKILKQNGNVVSKTLLSQDTYNPHNRIVHVGIK